MPRLILFATCQKAIMDRADNSVSMISLLNAIKVGIPSDEPIPSDAILNVNWAAVASWFRHPEDEGQTFQQRLQIVYPDGSISTANVISEPFIMDGPVSSTFHSLHAFPISQEGTYYIVLSLRNVENDNWQEVSRVPFEVGYERQESGQSGQEPIAAA